MKRLSCLSLSLVAAILTLAFWSPAVSAQQPTLGEVLAKAAQYVAAFADPSRALVCEESYEHTYYRRMVNTDGRSERLPESTRRWVAEKVILATPADEKSGFPWVEFRDILTLDRKPVHDGVSRLPKLLIEPKVASVTEAMAITKESGDSQAGRFERMVMLPRLPFIFLHAVNQPRFAFTKGGGRTIKGVKTMELKYQEKGSPTVLRASGGQDAPSSGSFWIDPATGATMASFFKNGDSSELYDELTTSYLLDAATGLWLPEKLTERMYDTQDEKEIDGKGTFAKWHFVPRG